MTIGFALGGDCGLEAVSGGAVASMRLDCESGAEPVSETEPVDGSLGCKRGAQRSLRLNGRRFEFTIDHRIVRRAQSARGWFVDTAKDDREPWTYRGSRGTSTDVDAGR